MNTPPIRKAPEGLDALRCEACKGSGIDPGDPDLRCSVCDGCGSRYMRELRERLHYTEQHRDALAREIRVMRVGCERAAKLVNESLTDSGTICSREVAEKLNHAQERLDALANPDHGGDPR